MIMTILITIVKVVVYGFCGWCAGKTIANYFLKRRISNASKKELKAEYFEKCGEIVRLIGTEEWDDGRDAFFKDIAKITNKMCEAGMGEIARQEFDNIRDLCKDLGYYVENDKDE